MECSTDGKNDGKEDWGVLSGWCYDERIGLFDESLYYYIHSL